MKKIFITVVIITGIFVAASSFVQPGLQESIKRGKEVYATHCQSCHFEKGEGMDGVYPPMAKNTNLKDAKKNIKFILNGQSGEITVNGKKYNSIMNPMNYLSDQEIADVLNYVRNSFGNKYPAITPAQVKAGR